MFIVVQEANGWFVASAPALDVVSQGPTREAAVTNLAEALVEFVLSCVARGTLEPVLRKAGLLPAPEEVAVPADDYLDEKLRP